MLWSVLALARCGGPSELRCAPGEVQGPLSTCQIDRAAPPCRCAQHVRCCTGDVCVGPVGAGVYCETCPLRCMQGVLFCADGTLVVSPECTPLAP